MCVCVCDPLPGFVFLFFKDGPEEVSKAVRKVPPHPSTMEMVKEALTALDQRKGVSAQAIRTFIKEKHKTVDETRLKTMVRKALVKGIESGALVRPANSTTTTGAQGRFRVRNWFKLVELSL